MATKRQDHPHWGTFATAGDLPNVTGSSTQSSNLVQGDLAFVTGDSTYQCQDETLGSAVWEPVGGGVPQSNIWLGGGYSYTQAVQPVEEVVGNGSFNASGVGGLTAYFVASITNVWQQTGIGEVTRVRLYDMGPAAGPPDSPPRRVTTLTFSAQGGPRASEQALTVTAGGVTDDDNKILSSARLYEVVIIQDTSTAGDVAYLGSAGLEVR